MNKNNDTKWLFLDGKLLAKMARGGAARLRSNAQKVNDLNVFPVPDGDTGDNMSRTIEGGVAALEGMESEDLAEVMSTFSRGMLLGARGNSGVILSQMFAGMTKGLKDCDKADPKKVGEALTMGVKQAYASVVTPTEGTILTVAREAVEYAVERIDDDSTIQTLFNDLIAEMYRSLRRTPELLAALKEAGVIDSGGAGLLYIMEGFNKILQGEEIEDDLPLLPTAEAPKIDFDAFGPDDEVTYGYCTELLIRLQNKKCDVDAFDVQVIIDYLQTLGDSIVAFKTESIVKLHVHTKTPEKVLEFCRQYGEFLTVKIENMSLQHNEGSVIGEGEIKMENAPIEKKRYGAVAVATGEGIASIFRDFGCDMIVEGGQTKNPSTLDFLDAFSEIHAEHIFVFPNNGNIVMAAKQAAEMYLDADVRVIETKDPGAGYAAISSMDPEIEDVEELQSVLIEASKRVTTGFVSPAVRDAKISGVKVKNGEYIGFIGKNLLVSCESVNDAAEQLLSKMTADGEKSMLTIFRGIDATDEQAAALEEKIAELYPDYEAYMVDGGQEVYPYIMIAE